MATALARSFVLIIGRAVAAGPLFSSGLRGWIRRAADGLLDVVPHGRAGVVHRQQQLGLRCDVLQITNQSGAVVAGLEMLLRVQVGMRLEKLRQSLLKF